MTGAHNWGRILKPSAPNHENSAPGLAAFIDKGHGHEIELPQSSRPVFNMEDLSLVDLLAAQTLVREAHLPQVGFVIDFTDLISTLQRLRGLHGCPGGARQSSVWAEKFEAINHAISPFSDAISRTPLRVLRRLQGECFDGETMHREVQAALSTLSDIDKHTRLLGASVGQLDAIEAGRAVRKFLTSIKEEALRQRDGL